MTDSDLLPLLPQLLKSLSHDLRNPLSAVVTNLEFAQRLLTREGADPDVLESVQDSATACEVLQRIIANLDVLARSDQASVTLLDVLVHASVDEVVDKCRNRIDQAGLKLDYRPQADSKRRAKLDRKLFELALENLLANSTQYAPSGSTLSVRVEEGQEDVRVVISDGGAAVPPQLRARAVAPEAHLHNARSSDTRPGRGLGLLVASIAARRAGVELELGGDDSGARATLVIRDVSTSHS